MATLGANVSASRSQTGAEATVNRLMGLKQTGKNSFANLRRIYVKAGTPASNTSADSPGRGKVFIIDTTNDRLYWVSTWTDANTFTVVRLDA